eukprot:scaffold5966_cov118-Cylindrotheca_fusiformis.AAC.23
MWFLADKGGIRNSLEKPEYGSGPLSLTELNAHLPLLPVTVQRTIHTLCRKCVLKQMVKDEAELSVAASEAKPMAVNGIDAMEKPTTNPQWCMIFGKHVY